MFPVILSASQILPVNVSICLLATRGELSSCHLIYQSAILSFMLPMRQQIFRRSVRNHVDLVQAGIRRKILTKSLVLSAKADGPLCRRTQSVKLRFALCGRPKPSSNFLLKRQSNSTTTFLFPLNISPGHCPRFSYSLRVGRRPDKC